jgi:hypothetical protein
MDSIFCCVAGGLGLIARSIPDSDFVGLFFLDVDIESLALTEFVFGAATRPVARLDDAFPSRNVIVLSNKDQHARVAMRYVLS